MLATAITQHYAVFLCQRGKAVLKIKQDGILAGVDVAQQVFHFAETGTQFSVFKKDGEAMHNGETAFEVEAHIHTILKCERLVLNCMQRMSGIATLTHQYTEKLKGYKRGYWIPAKHA
jgi:nicotinate-nucleotide pyrophosphorylase (carboxylating)